MKFSVGIFILLIFIPMSVRAVDVNFHQAYYGKHCLSERSDVATALNALLFGPPEFSHLHDNLLSFGESRLDRARYLSQEFVIFAEKEQLPPVATFSKWYTRQFASQGNIHLNLDLVYLQGGGILDNFFNRVRYSLSKDIGVVLVLDHYAVEDTGEGRMNWNRRGRHFVLVTDMVLRTKDAFGFMVELIDPSNPNGELIRSYVLKRVGDPRVRMGQSRSDDPWINLTEDHLTIHGHNLDTGSRASWAQRQLVVPSWAIMSKSGNLDSEDSDAAE
ncbi:MAG: hypothetical protein P1V20_27325 [Verrucomicrobiales bacterium]|nr:hypothetical protein [Verrucomicrobiales bacterium]